MATSLDALYRQPALRPIAPLVLAAWHDGHLTPAELLAIREALERGIKLDQADGESLRSWLDPDAPPPPHALRKLERELSGWLRDLPEPRRSTLASLGRALASGESFSEEFRTLLGTLYGGLSSHELALSDPYPEPDQAVGGLDETQRAELRRLLDGEHRPTRDEVRHLLEQPLFRFAHGLGTQAYREQVLTWLRAVTGSGLAERMYAHGMSEQRDIGRSVAAFETLAYFDLSLVVKYGVQTGLFAGAIESLGTKEHHALLPAILRGEMMGCFAMTERAHGSNVRALATLARYDPKTQQFVITTPNLGAGKEWIGNAAAHARMAVVFAQLETLGEGYGVHAFLVPIRDESGATLPGVRVEDCGEKMGLNGVDNGRLWFDDVRVPRSALLDRFGQVASDGSYASAIPSASKRFFTMVGTLVGGRISVSGGATSASKVGLTIALRYARARTQFPNASGREQPLLHYLTHRRRLIPRLAAAYAFSFAQHGLLGRTSHLGVHQTEARDVETLAAGLKALGTWQAIDTLQQCRECCGGQGYLTSNRIDALRTDTDVFTTFEGDNTVLLQLVANNLLRGLRRSAQEQPVRTLVKGIVGELVDRVSDRNPIAALREGVEGLTSLDVHAALMKEREEGLLGSLGRRVAKRVREGMDPQDAFEACQDHGLSLARAHVERFVLDSFQAVAKGHPVLEPLCALYGLWRVEADLAWFLEQELLSQAQTRVVRSEINRLCDELAGQADGLVDAFGIPSSCLGPLADPTYLRASGLAGG
jgi:acyl-CoA oxidase